MNEDLSKSIQDNQTRLIAILDEVNRRVGHAVGVTEPHVVTQDDLAWSIAQLSFIVRRMVRDDTMDKHMQAAKAMAGRS